MSFDLEDHIEWTRMKRADELASLKRENVSLRRFYDAILKVTRPDKWAVRHGSHSAPGFKRPDTRAAARAKSRPLQDEVLASMNGHPVSLQYLTRLGSSRQQVFNVMRHLVEDGLVTKVRRGMYLKVPDPKINLTIAKFP